MLVGTVRGLAELTFSRMPLAVLGLKGFKMQIQIVRLSFVTLKASIFDHILALFRAQRVLHIIFPHVDLNFLRIKRVFRDKFHSLLLCFEDGSSEILFF